MKIIILYVNENGKRILLHLSNELFPKPSLTNGVEEICVFMVAAIAATVLPLGTVAIGVVATGGDGCSATAGAF